MAKGNGTTRGSGGSSARGSSQPSRSEELSLKHDLAENRERIVSSLKDDNRWTGRVGEIVNAEVERAVSNIENAMKQMETAASVNDVNESDSNFHRVVRSNVARLSELADLHEHNMGYTTGRAKSTLQKAADALRMAAYNITEIDRGSGTYGGDILIKLEDIYHSQNRWK